MGWGDIVRVGTAIATGGASEVAIFAADKIDDAAGKAADIASGAAAGAAAAAGGGSHSNKQPCSSAPSVQVNSCCRYHLESPFLLDTQSGRVWRYDDVKKEFQLVPRESTAVEKSWETVITAKFTADAIDMINDATKNASRAEHLLLSGVIENHIKVLNAHVKKLAGS